MTTIEHVRLDNAGNVIGTFVLVKQICNTCDRKNIRLLSGKLSEISVFVKGALHRQSGFTLDETANL